MEIILNEYSVVGQFTSVDEFVDYALDVLKPILDMVIEKQIPFYRRQDMFDYKITDMKSLNDLFIKSGDPSISVIRSYIQQLGYVEPYWDNEPVTAPGISYHYPAKGVEPNCFTEAIERKGALLSFPNAGYDEELYFCKREREEVHISNITETKSFLNTYLEDDIQNVRYAIERYPFQRSMRLAEVHDRCYALEALLKNDLTIEDMKKILSGLEWMLEGITTGKKNHYWDKHQDEIWEFRIDVSSNRAFRLFFIQEDGIVFLNGFIKKSQDTPPGEIKKAIKLKKEWKCG